MITKFKTDSQSLYGNKYKKPNTCAKLSKAKHPSYEANNYKFPRTTKHLLTKRLNTR